MTEGLLWLTMLAYISASGCLLFWAASKFPKRCMLLLQVWGMLSLVVLVAGLTSYNRPRTIFIWDQFAVFMILFCAVVLAFRKKFYLQ